MKVNIKPDVILNEKAIMQDIEKFARTCATTIVEEAQNQLDKFAFGEMAEYYMEYEPRLYDRTGQMGDLSYQKFFANTGNVYEGGIMINSAFTNHDKGFRLISNDDGTKIRQPYTEEEIYDNVWIKGSHGYEKVGYGENAYWREIQGLPDRINRLKRKAYSRDFKRELLSKGFEKAKAQSYSILKFS